MTADEDEPTGVLGDDSRQRGIGMLVASIAAVLILAGVYIAAGGLDYKPTGAADPCDAREWTDPGNLEESAQQFALSAVDGGACDLGVSREELTRALVDEESRQAFAGENDLSDAEIEDALRSGLNRAIDDAEKAGVIDGLAVTGLRTAVEFMPVDQMIGLIENGAQIFEGGEINDVGDLINGVVGSLGADGGSTGDSGSTKESGATGDTGSASGPGGVIPDDLGDQIQQGLEGQLPDSIEKNVPQGIQDRLEEELNKALGG